MEFWLDTIGAWGWWTHLSNPLQGYRAHKKHLPRRTPQYPYAQGPMVILWGWVFIMSELPL